jgi:hypothetical protein
VTGGPNGTLSSYAAYPALQGVPAMKSYKDWCADYPYDSWEYNETAIYYTAAFVDLLANFATGAVSTTGTGLHGLGARTSLRARYSGGILSLDGMATGRVRLLDARGRQEAGALLDAGNARVGILPSGVHLLEARNGDDVRRLTLLVP